MRAVVILALALSLGCGGYVTEPLHRAPICLVGDAGYSPGPTWVVTSDGGACSVSSAMECPYCSGPVALVGGGDVECLGVEKASPCFGPVEGIPASLPLLPPPN